VFATFNTYSKIVSQKLGLDPFPDTMKANSVTDVLVVMLVVPPPLQGTLVVPSADGKSLVSTNLTHRLQARGLQVHL
jgi:hypothetical protein